MRIAYTPEQERLHRELRGYFGGLMTPEIRAALAGGDRADGDGDYGDGQAYRQVVRQLGRDGWLALGWPQEHGGRGGTMLDQLIFTDEAAIARVPVPFLTVNTVGPTIMRFGTPAQRSFYLPRIAAGEIHFSIGYSEPEAGTDLASLRTTATRDGEDYVIGADPDKIEADLALLCHAGVTVLPASYELGMEAGRIRARRYHRDRAAVSLADCIAVSAALASHRPLATCDPALAAVLRAEGGEVHALPDSKGRRP
jgi:predicted nucleic acid-binding protein